MNGGVYKMNKDSGHTHTREKSNRWESEWPRVSGVETETTHKDGKEKVKVGGRR